MSTTSFLERENSNLLAKRFAYLASTYFDRPEEARTPAARIPLENLFRMLQMFRYDSFSDEPRSGILELEGFSEQSQPLGAEELWHNKIESALRIALSQVFGNVPKEQAVREVQSVLTWLATDGNAPSQEVRSRSKSFLERFLAALD